MIFNRTTVLTLRILNVIISKNFVRGVAQLVARMVWELNTAADLTPRKCVKNAEKPRKMEKKRGSSSNTNGVDPIFDCNWKKIIYPSGCSAAGSAHGLGARDSFHLTAADNAEKRRKSVKSGENRRFESEPKCV